ncbi:hypothetical protein IGI04_023542 [Brassica rapa subsp. trilocularis]|uniref:Uncharacterized protein n=1 Tax=Brassica rapa subsp. trilocularis TaxID=1813537 RepID=A0ABQ7M476_BRACM|nr:hypothetical protein IGI04_023542 [Brassica rapa subsp. trilocularis]
MTFVCGFVLCRLNNHQMKNYGKEPASFVKLRCLDHTISIKTNAELPQLLSCERNHSSNATGDISLTTRSEERKRCSFNAYLYNQPNGSASYTSLTCHCSLSGLHHKKSEEAMVSPLGFNEAKIFHTNMMNEVLQRTESDTRVGV